MLEFATKINQGRVLRATQRQAAAAALTRALGSSGGENGGDSEGGDASAVGSEVNTGAALPTEEVQGGYTALQLHQAMRRTAALGRALARQENEVTLQKKEI